MTQAHQSEAQRLAAICETKGMFPVADELNRMHARILELEQAKCLHQIAEPAAQGLDAQALSEWLLARRSHLGPSRESAAHWCEEWGAKNWDNYTLLSKHFAAQAKQGGA